MLFDHTNESIIPDLTRLLTIGGDGLELPLGPTSARPTEAAPGTIRWNTESNALEVRQNNTSWTSVSSGPTVESINGRTGNVVINATDVTSALGYTPWDPNTTLLTGNRINDPNIGNVYNPSISTGINARRSLNLIDDSSVIKVVRTGGHPTIELQQWDSTLSTNISYWEIITTEGTLQFRDRTGSVIRSRLAMDPSGDVSIPGDVTIGGTLNANIPGRTLSRVYGNVPSTSGTTQIAWNNNIPASNVGTLLWSTTITPVSETSAFEIRFFPTVDVSSNGRYVIFALFRGTTCITVSPIQCNNANRSYAAVVNIVDEPNTTSPVTYSLRVGIGGGSGTWHVNSSNSGNNFGGRLANTWIITEFDQ